MFTTRKRLLEIIRKIIKEEKDKESENNILAIDLDSNNKIKLVIDNATGSKQIFHNNTSIDTSHALGLLSLFVDELNDLDFVKDFISKIDINSLNISSSDIKDYLKNNRFILDYAKKSEKLKK